MNKAEKMAEEYCKGRYDLQHAGHVFIAGFDACEKMYRDASDEFDLTAFDIEWERSILSIKCSEKYRARNMARWQHSQDQLKIVMHKEMQRVKLEQLEDAWAKINALEAELAKMKESREDIELNHLAELTAMEARE